MSPTDATGITDGTNVTTTVIDISDPANLYPPIADLYTRGVINGSVYSSYNSDGSVERGVSITGATGNTNAHSFAMLVKPDVDASMGVRLSGTSYTYTALTGSQWAVIGFSNLTPTDAVNKVYFSIPAGVTVQHILAHMEETTTLIDNPQIKEGTTAVDRIWLDGDEYTSLTLQNYTVAAHTGASTSVEGASTNKCTNYNFAPDAALTNVTDGTNLTTTRVTDDAELRLAGFGDLIDSGVMNGYVFKTVSTDGSTNRRVIVSGTVANTNKHSLNVFARSVSGSVALFLGSTSVATSSTAIGYEKLVGEDITPTANGNTVQVWVSPLNTVYWFGNQLEESTTVSSPIVTAGATGTRALDDAQLPVFSDNYLPYSEDFAQWNIASGAAVSGKEVSFDAITFSRIFDDLPDTTTGVTYYIYAKIKEVTSGQKFRLALEDAAGTLTSSDFTATSDFQYFEFSGSFTDITRRVRVLNASTGLAGTIEIDHIILSTSPILPAYLPTTGSAKVWEKGNMIATSEEMATGTGWAVNWTGTATPNYGLAPDGRQSTVLLNDTDTGGNTHWYYDIAVTDSSNTNIGKFLIRKAVGAVIYYPACRLRFQGGSGVDSIATIDPVAGAVTAQTGSVVWAVSTCAEDSTFWEVTGTITNNSSGNTILRYWAYPAFNTDGGSSGTSTTQGSTEFAWPQVIQHDVDSTDYLPTWGSGARKLKYNQIWENRVWMYGELPIGVVDNGDNQFIFDTYIDTDNRFRLQFNSAAGELIAQRRTAAVTANANITYAADGAYLGFLVTNSDTGGFTLTLANGQTDNAAAIADLVFNDTISLGATQLGASYLFAELANLKWGVLPAGGITLEGAKNATVD